MHDHDQSEATNYLPGQLCQWHIHPEEQEATSIVINFENFDVADFYDIVFLWGQFGYPAFALHGDELSVASFCFEGSYASVEFLSGFDSPTATGFTASYQAYFNNEPCPTFTQAPDRMSPACQDTVELSDTTGSLQVFNSSKYEDYLDDQFCSWNITVPNATSITLTFSEFELESTFDFLKIMGANETYDLTGSTVPGPICLEADHVMILCDSDHTHGSGGFSANYTASFDEAGCGCSQMTPAPTESYMDAACDVDSAPVLLTNTTGTIQDHDDSVWPYYEDNMLCSWNISVPNATSITLSFERFYLEQGWDFLYLNGPDFSQSFSGRVNPLPVCINASTLSVDFVSDFIGKAPGFKAVYEASSEPCPVDPMDQQACNGFPEYVSFIHIPESLTYHPR